MNFPATEMMQARKSVRTFDGRPIRPEDRAALEGFLPEIQNPFAVPVEFRLLDAKAHGLASPVILGADTYLAAKVTKGKFFELGFGYSFEAACLFARSLGLGTVMLAATLNRAAFEKAMDLAENQVLPVASPIGYPAARRSLRESMMRKGIKADTRLPFEALFFDGAFDKGLTESAAGIYARALELARWAPSAANKQPWRAVRAGDAVHFYEARSMKDSPLGDIQQVDVGIFLAHFDLALQEAGIHGRFLEADPGLPCPENFRYLISYDRNPM